MKILLHWIILTICLTLSCASLPPEKDFKTELWFFNIEDMQISRVNEENIEIFQNIEALDPSVWIVIKATDISKEWNFQKELIKSCNEWR